jgi:hypothetical protein
MSSDQSDDSHELPASNGQQTSHDQQATVLVRGETIRDNDSKAAPKDSAANGEEQAPRKALSEVNMKLKDRLPALDDDGDTGIEKQQTVIRDGEADLAFTGTLLASAAPASAPKGQWDEYRIYATNGGKHVFSKITRSVSAEQQDSHKAEIFDPNPSSVPSKLLRSARDLAHTRPMTWSDAAVAFFGYDPLAKALYRKLGAGAQFEEHIS